MHACIYVYCLVLELRDMCMYKTLMCIYTCIYIYMYTYIYIYIYVCVYVCIYIYMCVCVYVYQYLFLFFHIYIHKYIDCCVRAPGMRPALQSEKTHLLEMEA